VHRLPVTGAKLVIFTNIPNRRGCISGPTRKKINYLIGYQPQTYSYQQAKNGFAFLGAVINRKFGTESYDSIELFGKENQESFSIVFVEGRPSALRRTARQRMRKRWPVSFMNIYLQKINKKSLEFNLFYNN
jgi:hypothetical protein